MSSRNNSWADDRLLLSARLEDRAAAESAHSDSHADARLLTHAKLEDPDGPPVQAEGDPVDNQKAILFELARRHKKGDKGAGDILMERYAIAGNPWDTVDYSPLRLTNRVHEWEPETADDLANMILLKDDAKRAHRTVTNQRAMGELARPSKGQEELNLGLGDEELRQLIRNMRMEKPEGRPEPGSVDERLMKQTSIPRR